MGDLNERGGNASIMPSFIFTGQRVRHSAEPKDPGTVTDQRFTSTGWQARVSWDGEPGLPATWYRARFLFADDRRSEAASEPTSRYSAREHTLDTAKTLVCGDRNASYGPPDQDFARTAAMWTALFGPYLREGAAFTPADVAKAVICVKLSRSMHSPKLDNWIDAAGYAACGAECDQLAADRRAAEEE